MYSMEHFIQRRGECCGQYVHTLKDNCLVWNVIGCSDKRSITWLRKHAKLRIAKHPQWRNSWRKKKTLCSYSIDNNCIFGCFDTRLCKLVSLYPYGTVVNLIRFSFSKKWFHHRKEKLSYIRGTKRPLPCDTMPCNNYSNENCDVRSL